MTTSDHGAPEEALTPAVAGRRPWPGVQVAAATALISGISVFVNAHALHGSASPAVYTTAKNLVATTVLALGTLGAVALRRRRRSGVASRFVAVAAPQTSTASKRPTLLELAALAYIGVVGGGLAFVLFFDGLATTTATPAAFWRDTLVIWVAVLAVPLLHERARWWNVAAIGALVVGQVALAGGVGHLAASKGELDVLLSSVLWAVEAVVIKLVLRDRPAAEVALVRMGVGAFALLCVLAVSGTIGSLFALGAGQVGWVLVTGLLLSAYVATWVTALGRGRAIDVTSVLVGSVAVTAVLGAVSGAVPLAGRAGGLVLIAAGAATVVAMGLRTARPVPVGVDVR